MLKVYKTLIIILLINCIIILNIYSKNPVRIKDIAVIQGIRENQLMGFGLVTGLQGKGDSRGFKFTKLMLKNLALNYGYNVVIDDLNSKNIAAVLVIANINSFVKEGDLIDISVSSIGDCKSLEGGILLQTPLKGANNEVYAVAQGRILAGNRTNFSQNTASVPAGAIMEKSVTNNFINNNKINLIIKFPDFVTANQIREAILGLNSDLQVNAIDPSLIEIILGEEELKNPIDFIAQLEVLTVTPDYIASVVIDKKKGIIVMGEDVIIQECSISTDFGQITVKNNRKDNNFQIKNQTIGELVKTLNQIGLTNDEIISLIEAIYKIGAINAKLIIL